MGAFQVTMSDHARRQCRRRGLDESIVLRVTEQPEQIVAVRQGREVRQSRLTSPSDGIVYLVRVVVDVGPGMAEVVTAYRTSKVEKYWSAT